MDIDVNKCELPYACEDDSNSETSSNPSISPQTVISLDLDNDDAEASFSAHPAIGPGLELSPLFIDTSLANFTFEQFVTGNSMLNYCSQAPGYAVFRHMTSNIRSRTPRPRLPSSNATQFRRRRPVSEYLEYYLRMNTPLCITVDSLPESAWHYYNESHTHPHISNEHHQLSSDNQEPGNPIDVDSVRKWHSVPSVYFSDNYPYFADRYSPYDDVHCGTYPLCASDNYAYSPPGSTLEENIQFIKSMVPKNDDYEWCQGSSIDCERSDEVECFDCSAMQSQYQMDTNFTYQDPPMPENGPNHINWELQPPLSTHSPSFESTNVQYVSDPNPYQLMTETPYFGSIPYYYTHVAQPMICPCEECSQYMMMQGVYPYPYYYYYYS